MAKDILIVYMPDTPKPEGYIPSIEVQNPYKRGEVLIPEMEEIEVEGQDEPLFGFKVPDVAGRQILATGEHVWKLWEPESLHVQRPASHGSFVRAEVKSVKDKTIAHGKSLAKTKAATAKNATEAAAAAAAAAASGNK